MAKKERNLTDKYAQSQMGDIKSSIGGTTSTLQGQYPGAQATAMGAYGTAAPAAENLALTGGISPGMTAEMEKTATNLAETGGISPADQQAMITSASRGARSVYDVLGAEAKRKAAITGGYGGSGEMAKMARQASQAESEAVTDARAKVAGLTQTGKIAGASALTGVAGVEQSGKVAGAKLLTTQYGLTQQQADTVMDQILKSQTAGIQLTQGDIDLLAQMSKEPGAFQSVMSGIGQLAGGVGGLLTGIGSI